MGMAPTESSPCLIACSSLWVHRRPPSPCLFSARGALVYSHNCAHTTLQSPFIKVFSFELAGATSVACQTLADTQSLCNQTELMGQSQLRAVVT